MNRIHEGYFALFLRTGDPRFYLLAKHGAEQEDEACKRS